MRMLSRRLGALLVAGIYAAGSSGLALIRWARFPSGIRRTRTPLALLNVVVVIGIVLMGVIAVITRHALRALVPDISSVAATLWTAAVAGVVGAFIVRVSAQPETDDR